MIPRFFLFLGILSMSITSLSAQEKPIRLGIAGLTHGHISFILGRKDKGDIVIVGIVETNKDLAKRLSSQYGFSMTIVYDKMEDMIAGTKPEAVVAFGDIYSHLSVVEACAPKGIPVMVEKPLAISLDHAKKIEALSKKYNVPVLTDFETAWYPTNTRAGELLESGVIGNLRKAIVRDGHKGFKGVKVNNEFIKWLTDPAFSGGGAIMDFGCYGANLMTWLKKGVKPNSVTAVTSQLQPDINPKVDDDATIILKYDSSMAILEPSWNWPMGRKDMELYGTTGAIYADNRNQLRIRMAKGYDGFDEQVFQLEERPAPFDDPIAVFISVIRGKVKLGSYDPYSLENNVITMEILDAAIKSAKSQKTIELDK